MKYITHHRFKGIPIYGKRVNIPYGTELETMCGVLITRERIPVCFVTSENAKMHFSRNDDGRGLERGRLTYAIAYASRDAGGGFRFSEGERKMLERDWSHFLRRDVNVILFNEAFFAAEPEELGRLANALKIKVRR